MAYTKINFTEVIPLSVANLDKLETIYDSILEDSLAVRSNNTIELVAQIVLADPAPDQARIIYNQTENRFKYSDGSAWFILALPGEVGIT